jgi:hypothetical protein
VDTFRSLMLICAGMVWLSAVLAALLVDRKPRAGEPALDKAVSAP